MASTQSTEDLYWFGTEPNVQLPETCEYVLLNAKVLYNKGYASYSPTRSKSSRKGKCY